jgi:hypothetical protein
MVSKWCHRILGAAQEDLSDRLRVLDSNLAAFGNNATRNETETATMLEFSWPD